MPTGFTEQFANVGNEPSTNDQSHHFAAFFQLGFRAGKEVGVFAAQLYDAHTGNSGDRALGQWAAELGAQLRAGTITQDQVSQRIRSTLCK